MNTIPPTFSISGEEWPEDDFDIPDGQPLHAGVCGKGVGGEEEDWDLEMDFGQQQPTAPKLKPKPFVAAVAKRPLASGSSQMFTIRPPISVELDEMDDDEGVSTIKVNALPMRLPTASAPILIDDDVESAFALPEDLTQLSLAPLSLNHRSSKNSLEWGDKDHTSSSQSSDTFSSLGFGDTFPSSNSASSASSINLPETEDEEEDDDGELDGLVIPSGLFESGQSGRKLNKILEKKRRVQITGDQVKVVSPDPEDDFEIGLVIEDDVDLCPTRLLLNTQQKQKQSGFSRSYSAPLRSSSALRPPSRTKGEHRAKSPTCPTSSSNQLRKLRLSPSPPLSTVHQTRSQTFQTLSSIPPTAPSPTSFLSPKPGSLRGQKSHSGLKPPTPPSTQRKVTRKASLPHLKEINQPHASGSGLVSADTSPTSRYEAPTAASRAKTHKNPSTSRIHAPEFIVPPTRPSTPSSNPAALRLTMPTAAKKSRPALSTVFSPPPPLPTTINNNTRPGSPVLSRPASSASLRAKRSLRTPSISQPQPPPPPVPKVLRRPKRARTYGDGTELDAFDDLPTDRDKEGLFRVQPKGFGNRIPGGSYPAKSNVDKGTVRKKGRRESLSGGVDPPAALVPPTNTLKRTGRISFDSKPMSSDIPSKKKKGVSSPSGQTKRKPTLIRNLNGASAPKVVGDMKWNPNSLRWEGNDHILRDFDTATGTSTRLGLITQLTGSSIGGSPVGTFVPGARMVGNMIFDPARMCWVSTLPPDEDEPDVFANLADDEDDTASWEVKGGTIRASLPTGGSSVDSSATCSSEAPSPARCRVRAASESGSDRGSRASMVVCDIDDAFLARCRLAEERHRSEMKGWRTRARQTPDSFAEPDKSYLYDIRALATRKY